jgi:hypothetical protein
MSATATQKDQQIPPCPIDVVNSRQVEIQRELTAHRVGHAPAIFQLADPRTREIALELQANTVCLRLYSDPEHGALSQRGNYDAERSIARIGS